MRQVQIACDRVRAVFEPDVGHLPVLQIDGMDVLHAAPWRKEPDIQVNPDIPRVDRRLGGTFVCAPFGQDDVTHGPPHGAPANSRWLVAQQGQSHLTARLAADLSGASLQKTLTLRDGSPALYQTHILSGGAGPMTFAHHPMFHLRAGGRLRCSAKRAALTEPAPQHPGAQFWVLGQTAMGFDLETASGEVRDLRDYPEVACEDFVTLVGAETETLGWTALERFAEEDTILVLKDARALPLTLLWVSNGGRDFAPWNSRHTGVLGIEDARCAGGAGFAAATRSNRITELGVPSCVQLGAGPIVIRQAILRLPGLHTVAKVRIGERLELETEEGTRLSVPFDPTFFA